MDKEPVKESGTAEKESSKADEIKESDTEWDRYINDSETEEPDGIPEDSISPDTFSGEPEDTTAADHLTIPVTVPEDDPEDEPEDDPFPISMIPEDDLMDATPLKLDEILSEIQELKKDFGEKIKNDARKDKIIDELHKELQSYKNDFLKKYLELIMMDIIQFIDSMRKLAAFYKEQDPAAIDSMKLLGILKDIPSDLEDLCARQGVNAFHCPEENFNPTRQRVLRRVETYRKEKEKMIADRIHPGYEWDGKIIRPELVTVYAYKSPTPETEVRNSDE